MTEGDGDGDEFGCCGGANEKFFMFVVASGGGDGEVEGGEDDGAAVREAEEWVRRRMGFESNCLRIKDDGPARAVADDVDVDGGKVDEDPVTAAQAASRPFRWPLGGKTSGWGS